MGESGDRFAPGSLLAALLDLVVPLVCGGCGRPGVSWCAGCARRLDDAPRLVRPRVRVGVPVWTIGAYRDPMRSAIVGVKERHRRDLVAPLGGALVRCLSILDRWGELPDARRLVLVPAPTRALAARRRGGDPVEAYCRAAAVGIGGGAHVAPLLRTRALVRDSAGLSAGERSANLRGAVRLRTTSAPVDRSCAVVLVDDVVTTGATIAESVRVLRHHGVPVDLAVALAAAD
ncbi:ComF family protein [Gordonia sp. (in: high G+C Gram-positive bacteria)]|uniref:ComF family protein n=1 Tax=Gordonia sp. (in: high G+C Gram-positive bacteria) TaxID=84139 RepID=UPI0039E69A2A